MLPGAVMVVDPPEEAWTGSCMFSGMGESDGPGTSSEPGSTTGTEDDAVPDSESKMQSARADIFPVFVDAQLPIRIANIRTASEMMNVLLLYFAIGASLRLFNLSVHGGQISRSDGWLCWKKLYFTAHKRHIVTDCDDTVTQTYDLVTLKYWQGPDP